VAFSVFSVALPSPTGSLLITLIELIEQADDDQRTFECWSCSYFETVVADANGPITIRIFSWTSALESNANILQCNIDVRFTPQLDMVRCGGAAQSRNNAAGIPVVRHH
jgi:hypothetical protein